MSREPTDLLLKFSFRWLKVRLTNRRAASTSNNRAITGSVRAIPILNPILPSHPTPPPHIPTPILPQRIPGLIISPPAPKSPTPPSAKPATPTPFP